MARSCITNRTTVCVIVLLMIHGLLLAWSGYRHSPTVDEPAHLAAGISHWQFGRMDLYCVNPPLVRMIAALPVMAADPQTAWGQFRRAEESRAEFEVGEAFADANGRRIFWLTTLARWSCIPFSLLGGWVCFLWSRELFGVTSGLMALTLWCFSPSVLGNGSLITADVPSAALCVATVYLFSRWLISPSWEQCLVVGSCLGLALLTKSSMIFLCALLPAMWLICAGQLHFARKSSHPGMNQSFGSESFQLTTAVCLAILILNLGYGMQGSGTPLKDYAFRSQTLGGLHEGRRSVATGNRFADSWIAEIPVPLPKAFVIGIDRQKYDFETGLRSYLLGRIKQDGEGWWWFYLYAALLKIPLGTWCLALMAVPVAIRWRLHGQLLLIVPLLFFLVLVSSQVGLNFFRYLLPAYPFGFLLVSQVVRDGRPRSTLANGIIVVALGGSVLSSLVNYPHSLAYFNALAGGSGNGYRIMADANLDWGQDLIYLDEWIQHHPEAIGLTLHYYGPVAPERAGLPVRSESSRDHRRIYDSESAQQLPESEWIAVSVTRLAHQYALFHKRQRATPNLFVELYDREPDERIGYTIHLYRAPRGSADQPVRRSAGTAVAKRSTPARLPHASTSTGIPSGER